MSLSSCIRCFRAAGRIYPGLRLAKRPTTLMDSALTLPASSFKATNSACSLHSTQLCLSAPYSLVWNALVVQSEDDNAVLGMLV